MQYSRERRRVFSHPVLKSPLWNASDEWRLSSLERQGDASPRAALLPFRALSARLSVPAAAPPAHALWRLVRARVRPQRVQPQRVAQVQLRGAGLGLHRARAARLAVAQVGRAGAVAPGGGGGPDARCRGLADRSSDCLHSGRREGRCQGWLDSVGLGWVGLGWVGCCQVGQGQSGLPVYSVYTLHIYNTVGVHTCKVYNNTSMYIMIIVYMYTVVDDHRFGQSIYSTAFTAFITAFTAFTAPADDEAVCKYIQVRVLHCLRSYCIVVLFTNP